VADSAQIYVPEIVASLDILFIGATRKFVTVIMEREKAKPLLKFQLINQHSGLLSRMQRIFLKCSFVTILYLVLFTNILLGIPIPNLLHNMDF